MSKIVGRTLDVFELFAAERRPLSLTDIKRLLDIPISSCHDVVQALEARGYLYEVAPRSGYYPTMRLFNLCSTIIENDPVAARVEPVLQSLRDEFDESCLLVKASGLRLTYLLVLETKNPLRFSVTVGETVRTLHATSAGKAVLGSLGREQLDEFLRGYVLEPLTPKTITSKARLRADLEEANRRGWVLNREESQPGVVTISSRFVSNDVLYVVTMAGPASRMEGKLARAADAVVGACQSLDQRSQR